MLSTPSYSSFGRRRRPDDDGMRHGNDGTDTERHDRGVAHPSPVTLRTSRSRAGHRTPTAASRRSLMNGSTLKNATYQAALLLNRLMKMDSIKAPDKRPLRSSSSGALRDERSRTYTIPVTPPISRGSSEGAAPGVDEIRLPGERASRRKASRSTGRFTRRWWDCRSGSFPSVARKALPHRTRRAPRPYPCPCCGCRARPRRSTCPGSAPVCSPASITTTPLTITVEIPAA